MPPKKVDSEENGAGFPALFNQREQDVIVHAFHCMSEFPSIDAEKLAGRLGMTNPRSATNAWSAIRKKLVERNAELGGSDDIGPNKLGRPGKRKAGGSSDGENPSSPAKRGRGRPPRGGTPKKAAKRGGKMNTTEHDSPAHQAQRADDAQQSEGHESPIKAEPNEAEVEDNAGEI